MIIGGKNNNFPSEQDRFNTRLNAVQENASLGQTNKWNQLDSDLTKSYDVNNKEEMTDKSLAMLQDRLNNGLISMDEFHKKWDEYRMTRIKAKQNEYIKAIQDLATKGADSFILEELQLWYQSLLPY